MDEYDRNDSIFITRNSNGITVKNLCTILKEMILRRVKLMRVDIFKELHHLMKLI